MKRIIILCLSLALLFACVPTPEEEFVSHKDADQMLESATVDDVPVVPIREQYGIPETLTDEEVFADGAFTIRIDARVEVPDTNAIPILRVERDVVDQKTVTTIFNRLCAGRTLYRSGDSSMTKTQIAERINELLTTLEDPSLDAGTRASFEAQVASLKEQFPTAPDSADELIASDGTMYSYPCRDNADSPEFLRYGLRLQTNDDLPPLFFDVRITDPDNPNTTENGKDAQKSSYLGFMDDRNRAHGGDGQTRIAIRNPDEPTELNDYPQVTYLPKQAIEDAKQFLADVGLNDIAPDAIALVFDGAQAVYGYQINCVRVFGGINGTNLHATTYLDMNERYAPEWDYEEIELYIDAQGVYDFSWGYPVRVTETLKDATKLLPFEKIIETFKSRIWTENAVWIVTDLASAGGDEQGFCTTGLDFEITRITLSLQRVMEPNRFDSGMLVPVWNFWGVKRMIDTHKTTGEQKTIVRDDRMTNPFLSINAIDGSVIDPWVGY